MVREDLIFPTIRPTKAPMKKNNIGFPIQVNMSAKKTPSLKLRANKIGMKVRILPINSEKDVTPLYNQLLKLVERTIIIKIAIPNNPFLNQDGIFFHQFIIFIFFLILINNLNFRTGGRYRARTCGLNHVKIAL